MEGAQDTAPATSSSPAAVPASSAVDAPGKGQVAPPNPNAGKRDVYIAGLPSTVDDAKLKELFSPYGEITWVRALQRDGKVNGLIEFATHEQASWVVENMKGTVPAGLTDPIFVKFKDDPHERMAMKGYGKGNATSTWAERIVGDAGLAAAAAPAVLAGLLGWAWENEHDGFGKGTWFSPAGGVMPRTVMPKSTNPLTVVPPRPGCKGGPPLIDLPAPSPSDNVYLRNLPAEVTEERLKTILGTFGNITQFKMMPGQGKTSALVRFSSVKEATALVTGLKGAALPGISEAVEVKYAESLQARNQRYATDGTPFGIETIVKGFQMSGLMPGGTGYSSNSENALYIAGLPSDTNDYYLYRLFSPLGSIAPKGVHTMLNEDGTCKGIAFVNYLDSASAHMAISIYNGTIMPDGTRLKVAIKVQKPQVLVTPSVPASGTSPATSKPIVMPPTPASTRPLATTMAPPAKVAAAPPATLPTEPTT